MKVSLTQNGSKFIIEFITIFLAINFIPQQKFTPVQLIMVAILCSTLFLLLDVYYPPK